MQLDHRRADKGIDDPRDNLEKARRMELVRFAQACGLKHITALMPAILIRQELRSRNLTNIRIPPRTLGAQNHPQAMAAPPGAKIVEVNATADLARQYALQQAQPDEPEPARPPAKSKQKYPNRLVERPKQEINVLRDYCKANGIKMDRRDNKETLRAKVTEHRAQHGQDAAQRGQ